MASRAEKVKHLIRALTCSIFELEDAIFRLYALIAATGRESEIPEKRVLLEAIVKLKDIFSVIPDAELPAPDIKKDDKERTAVKNFVKGSRAALETISEKLSWVLDCIENEEQPPELAQLVEWAKCVREASAELANDFETYFTIRPIKLFHINELYVRISEAKALVASSMTGSLDPYCALTVDGERKHRTQTVAKSESPTWLRDFEVDLEPSSKLLGLHIYDRDRTNLTSDELIAERGFLISDLKEVKHLENWFPLFPKNSVPLLLGSLHLRLRYVPPSPSKTSGSLFVTVVSGKNLDITACQVCLEECVDKVPDAEGTASGSLVSPRSLLQPRDATKPSGVVHQQFRTADSTSGAPSSPVWNESFGFRIPIAQLPNLLLRVHGWRGKGPVCESGLRLATLIEDPTKDYDLEFSVRVEPSVPAKKLGELRLQIKLASHKVLAPHAYDELLVTLIQGDDTIKLFSRLLDGVATKKDIVRSLVSVLIDRGVANQFIKRAVAIEIDSTTDVGTLFRANSFASLVFDANLSICGVDLLQRALKEHISDIYKSKRSLEPDPSRAAQSKSGRGANVEKNIENLTAKIAAVWNSIQLSAEFLPQQVRSVFAFLQRSCREKFPNDPTVAYLAPSGFLFLRYFCAAILNPHLFGLSEEYPSEKVARNLTLLSKILMSLANLVPFGAKEQFLEPMNPFIKENIPKMKNYIDFSSVKTIGTRTIPKVNYAKEMAHLYAFLVGKLPMIEEELEKTQDVKIARILAAMKRINEITETEEQRHSGPAKAEKL